MTKKHKHLNVPCKRMLAVLDLARAGGRSAVSGTILNQVSSGKPQGYCPSFGENMSKLRRHLAASNETIICRRKKVNDVVEVTYQLQPCYTQPSIVVQPYKLLCRDKGKVVFEIPRFPKRKHKALIQAKKYFARSTPIKPKIIRLLAAPKPRLLKAPKIKK